MLAGRLNYRRRQFKQTRKGNWTKQWKLLQNSLNTGLNFFPLNKGSPSDRVYADSSHVMDNDSTLQLGYLALLCDAISRWHLMDFL